MLEISRPSRGSPRRFHSADLLGLFGFGNVRLSLTPYTIQESKTETEGTLPELLLSIVAWVAKMGSQRHPERTKAGLQRARPQGEETATAARE